jgi:hypothetical protein
VGQSDRRWLRSEVVVREASLSVLGGGGTFILGRIVIVAAAIVIFRVVVVVVDGVMVLVAAGMWDAMLVRNSMLVRAEVVMEPNVKGRGNLESEHPNASCEEC